MSSTDIREALHGVAETTPVPPVDRLALQRRVAQARRRSRGKRGGVAVLVVAASVALVAAVGIPLGGGGGAGTESTSGERTLVMSEPPGGPVANLSTPVYYLLDGRLHVLDPQGRTRDLELAAEEIIGSTYESVYVIDTESTVQRFDARQGQGPEGQWTFTRTAAPVSAPVQSARLSADGRWLGWVDLDERLQVRDLKADQDSTPQLLPPSSYLADMAQGTGAALVSQDGDLVLRTVDGDVAVPTAGDGYGWASTASAERVAVVDRDATTRVYDVATGTAALVGEVPGSGYLSPYGDQLATVHSDRGSSQALLWSPDTEPAPLPVPGRVLDVAWADDDTVLVVSVVGATTVVHACDGGDSGCTRLPLTGDRLTLAR